MAQRSRSRRGLATWLADSTTPLFVLDTRRKVLFFNHGCELLTGWDAGDVIGQVCDYVSEPDPAQVESLTGSLCPPPDICDGQELSVPTFIITKRGEKRARVTRFIPLTGDEGTTDRILGVISPLNERTKPASAPDRQLHAELASIRADLRKHYEVTSLVGTSAVFRRILSQIDLARQSKASVHFVGERGTGREQIARMIHYQGPDRLRAFVPLDCGRLSSDEVRQTLERVFAEEVESEIPHLRPGVIFLRNVDLLPADVQQDLVTRWSSPDPPALRLMSDSLSPLQHAVAADRMTGACCELLTSLVIPIPPLRERMEDFALLAQDMLERQNRDRDSQVGGLSSEVWDAFRKYTWPGNQDELLAVLRESRDACRGKLITASDLPFRFRTGQESLQVNPPRIRSSQSLSDRLEEVEREHILEALESCGQNKSQAAQRLGITRPKLYRRMEQLGLAESGTEG